MTSPIDLSVVVITLNEGDHLKRTIDHLDASLPPRSEIVVVDDGSEDGSAEFLSAANASPKLIRTERIGVAKARNRGARESHGRCIFFADAHLSMARGCWEPLLQALDDPAVGGVAPAISDMEHPEHVGYGLHFRGPDLMLKWLPRQGDDPYAVPLVPWCCGGLRRAVLDKIGGFDDGMIRWGMVDNEMSLRLWLAGFEQRVVPRVDVAHLFKEEFPYRVQWTGFLHNVLRLAFLYFDTAHVQRVVEGLREYPDFAAGLALALGDGLCARRAELERQRVRDISWYFDTFPTEW